MKGRVGKKISERSNKDSKREERETTKEFLKELENYELSEDAQIDAEELNKLINGEKGLISFEDMDARWGYKREYKPFSGYKAHVSMDESGIVSKEIIRFFFKPF